MYACAYMCDFGAWAHGIDVIENCQIAAGLLNTPKPL